MSTLYELQSAYQVLLEMAEDPETDQDFLDDTLEGLEGEIEEKCDGLVTVIKELEGRMDMLYKEIARLDAWKKACDRNAKRIKERIQAVMVQMGKDRIETGRFKLRMQKNPPSLVLDVESWKDVPEDYLRYRDPEIDKAKIKADIKAGKDLSGIAHEEQGRSLRIS